MYQNQDNPIYFSIVSELQTTQNYSQSFQKCRNILQEIEKITKSRVISYFSVFKPALGVIDSDATFIEDLLRCKNQFKPLILILNSPGGQAVAAEKILLVCQAYALVNKTPFYVIIPKSAKSAATIVALGADKILMSKTAELGATDPQIIASTALEKGQQMTEEETTEDNKKTKKIKQEKIFDNITNVFPAFQITKSIETLLEESSKFWKFNRGAYNQFLSRYGYDIYTMAKNELKLSEDIIQKILNKKKEQSKIDDDFIKAFNIFLEPELTFSHNRQITLSDLKDTQLSKTGFIQDYVEFYKKQRLPEAQVEQLDALLWEYYFRTNAHLEDEGNPVSKTIESSTHRFHLTSKGQLGGIS